MKPRRSRHLTRSLSTETSFPTASVPCQQKRELFALRVGLEGSDLLATEDYEKRAPKQRRFRRVRPRGSRGGWGQQCRQQQRRGDARRATRTCSVSRTCENDRKHASRGQTSECPGGKVGSVRHIRARFLRKERLVGRQQCGGAGDGQASHGVHEATVFRGPPCLELQARVLAAGREPTCPELPGFQRIEESVTKPLKTQTVACPRRCSPLFFSSSGHVETTGLTNPQFQRAQLHAIAEQRPNSIVAGGSTTNFLVDLFVNSNRSDASDFAMRECSRNPLREFLCTPRSPRDVRPK